MVTRPELEAFAYRGQPLKLLDRGRGIRNPAQLQTTITILSQPSGPYDDDLDPVDGLLRYAYRTGGTDGGDNRKLRWAAELGLPLILLQGIAPGIFVPRMPVFLVDDDPVARIVKVAVDESLRFVPGQVTSAPTSSDSPGSACTSRSFVHGCWPRTPSSARSVGSGTPTCWTPRTSSATPTAASRLCPTG